MYKSAIEYDDPRWLNGYETENGVMFFITYYYTSYGGPYYFGRINNTWRSGFSGPSDFNISRNSPTVKRPVGWQKEMIKFIMREHDAEDSEALDNLQKIIEHKNDL